MRTWFKDTGDSIMLKVRVVPRSSKDAVAGIMADESLKVRIQAPPVDGKANIHLVKFLSKQWNIPRMHIEIHSGETGRIKSLRITGPTDELRKELLSIKSC